MFTGSYCKICSYLTWSGIFNPFRYKGYISIILRRDKPFRTTGMLLHSISTFSDFFNREMTLFDAPIAMTTVVALWH